MWKKWSIVSTFQIHCCASDCPVRTWSSSQLYPVHFSSSPCLILNNERPSSPSSLDLQPFICFCCVWGFQCLVSLVWTPLIFLFGVFYTEDRLPSRYSQELFDAFILGFRLRLAEYVNKKSICWYSVVFGSKFPSAAGLQSWGEKRTRSLIGFSVSTHLFHPYTSKVFHQKGQLGQQNSFIRHMATWKHASG